MAKVSPFHSIKQSVYHDNNSCTEGNNIPASTPTSSPHWTTLWLLP